MANSRSQKRTRVNLKVRKNYIIALDFMFVLVVLYFLKSKFQIVEFVELIVTYFMEQFPMLVIDLFQVH